MGRQDLRQRLQPHRRADGQNVVIDGDEATIPAITSAAAGGIRCDLTDMLAWAQNWLTPTLAQRQWLSPTQRDILQAPHMLIPVSAQRRAWDHTHIMAYGYGWRMADVDGAWTVWHTGTLNGMYSMLALLPDRQSGFVFMINGDAGAARSVLGEVLTKYFTAPTDPRDVSWYADALERNAHARAPTASPPTAAGAQPVTPEQFAPWAGVYRDLWFGDVTICARAGAVHFAAAKSPKLAGTVLRLHARYLVHWDNPSVDPDAWLDFHAASGEQPITLRMAKLDPLGDFSSDYEDLHLARAGECR